MASWAQSISEKITFRVLSGHCPLSDPRCAWPRRGGAGSARPWGMHHASRNVASFRPAAYSQLLGNHDMPRFSLAPYSGRAERVPPTKPPSALCQGFPREAILAWIAPAEGRAPHAHNEGIGFARACPPWALGSSITPGDHNTPRFAAGLTTRTHGVRPSEETAFRVISGSFPLRRLIGPSTPAEGRAPHAP